MTKWKTLVISDVHLGTADSRAKDLLKFLKINTADTLILNGDIIDGWALERGTKWKKVHTRVVKKLLNISTKSEVIWIRGNHDDFIRQFKSINIGRIKILEDIIITNDNDTTKTIICHGDQFDSIVTRFKWLAKIGSIGYDIALFINRWYNKWREYRGLEYYSISKIIKERVKEAVKFITDFETAAADYASLNNCNSIICGHIHKAEIKYINGIKYMNSGDWVESRTAIAETHSGEWQLIEYTESPKF